MKIKPATLFLSVCGVALAAAVSGWFGWLPSLSHGQGSVETHEHEHVHGEGIDHDHEHEGMEGSVAHSHPHQHDRHHHGPVTLPDQPDLTEIGHSHDASSELTLYWGKLVVEDDGRYVLRFFQSRDGKVDPYVPVAENVTALIYNGSKLEGRATFARIGGIGEYVAELPDGFFALPTHLFQFQNLKFRDLTTDAMLSVVP